MTLFESLGLASLALATVPAGADCAPLRTGQAVTAQCLVSHLPQGAQMFTARDGTVRVVAAGRRGAVARWTIAGTTITRSGGAAGLDGLVGGCVR